MKKGFVSMTVVYTFLVVFLLLMSTLLISYINRSNYSGKLASDTKNYLNSKTSFTIQMNVPNGTASPVSKNIAMGGTSTFTITPSSGYTLEGASVTCEQATASIDTSTGVVTVSDATQNQTCTVVLQESGETYTITMNVINGGVLDPSSVTVSSGEWANFAIYPGGDYQLRDVMCTPTDNLLEVNYLTNGGGAQSYLVEVMARGNLSCTAYYEDPLDDPGLEDDF